MWNILVQITFQRKRGAYCKSSLHVCTLLEEKKKAIKQLGKLDANLIFFILQALKNGLQYRSYCFLNLSFHFPFNTKKTASPSRYLMSFYITVSYCNTNENKLKYSCRESLQIYILNNPNLYTKAYTLIHNFKFLIINYILIYKYWI